MRAAGFEPADYEAEPVEVWPESWPAWSLFCEMSGQWRMAPMGGAVALDYCALFMRMERLQLAGPAWDEMFHDVRAIEAAALKQMSQSTP